MSFYTALTGLNAATAQMGVTSNNIANVSTAVVLTLVIFLRHHLCKKPQPRLVKVLR